MVFYIQLLSNSVFSPSKKAFKHRHPGFPAFSRTDKMNPNSTSEENEEAEDTTVNDLDQ
jgi:hypothetical protein